MMGWICRLSQRSVSILPNRSSQVFNHLGLIDPSVTILVAIANALSMNFSARCSMDRVLQWIWGHMSRCEFRGTVDLVAGLALFPSLSNPCKQCSPNSQESEMSQDQNAEQKMAPQFWETSGDVKRSVVKAWIVPPRAGFETNHNDVWENRQDFSAASVVFLDAVVCGNHTHHCCLGK